MAYTTIDDPTIYFNTKLWTGNATDDTAITGVGFSPDWVWIKNRSTTDSHHAADSVIGVGKRLRTDTTAVVGDQADGVKSFDSDGITIGTTGSLNGSGNSIVAWCWKAGASFSNDASATSVGSIDSAGSTSSDSGFSIVSYTGTGSAGTIAHNLGAVPTVIIQKNRDAVQPWWTYHSAIGAGGQLRLNGTDAEGTDGGVIWNSTAPTSTVFSVGDNDGANGDDDDCIAYCFYEKQGFSKFGRKYTGNGNVDGAFVYTGFTPAIVIIKVTSATSSWEVYDTKRNTFNPTAKAIFPDGAGAEYDYTDRIDILSNGFKTRVNETGVNTDGGSYVYMAFAEAPLVNSEGVPANAR